ncbi:DUF3298 and DUF4163 domain-containing protein [Pseudoxanthomonas sp.]|uniref:DUF3298 and DUF4163 domain-containing protein n=1 Tax=Pseudoxanthomonas sp. TaxID=1871049 RepID=UPI00262AB039|nr:DUF3298 and DUF4163 domain-containing protein [Pseudoxanthomonas sp.]WDS37188.1 MAG: DUF3298 domain-containing protein [Pseudoxanthomonas sp.]
MSDVGNGKTIIASLLLASLLAGCNQPPSTPATSASPVASTPAEASTQSPSAATALSDVAESDPRYVVGISYPPQANQYPGLAKAMGDYATAARAELMQAVNGLGGEKPVAPYELSLAFEVVAETPEVVAVAADGGRYTGGAHGEPLVARFTWLPRQQAMLTTQAMLPSPEGLQAVSSYVREQLHTSASLRADGDDMAPEDRAQLLQSSNKMIDEGTGPDLANFSQFQPVVNADGRIAAIRFVFPPYQVGPYADGTQTVDVPAQVLQPYVAPEYAPLFLK